MLQVIFEPVSNRADWVDQVEVRDGDTDDLVDLSAATIVLAVRDPSTKMVLLTAQTSNGTITIDGLGVFGFTFTVSQMRGLDAGKRYEVGCTIKIGGVTQQFFTGSVSVLEGIVS